MLMWIESIAERLRNGYGLGVQGHGELGQTVKKSAPTVTNALALLAIERKVYYVASKKLFVVTNIGEKRVDEIVKERPGLSI